MYGTLYREVSMKAVKEKNANTQHAVMDLIGATCTSCSIAVEHLARRLNGVADAYVDRATRTIHVAYYDAHVLERIKEFVGQLGYKATIREKESTETFRR